MSSEAYAVGDIVEYGPPVPGARESYQEIGTRGVVTKISKHGIRVCWNGKLKDNRHDFDLSARRVLVVAPSEEFVEDLV